MPESAVNETLARHSTEIHSIVDTQAAMQAEIITNRERSDRNFVALTEKINSVGNALAEKISSIGRANYPMLIGIVVGVLGVATSFIVGGYFVIQLSIKNAVSPVEATAMTAADTAKTLALSHAALTAEVSRLTAASAVATTGVEKSLKEVETQFRAADEVRNMEIAVSHRTFSMLWAKEFPDVPYPNIVYYPHIAK